jgi:gluconokinase
MIVVVFGVAASGKSTLGKALAAALAWPFVEGDDFHPESNRKRMAAGIALGDDERAPWLDALARSLAQHADAGRSAVYACSALKRSYRAALLAHGVPAREVRFVHLHAPRALLEERLARRRGHFFPVSLLESQLRDLEAPGDAEPAPTVSVDAARPVEQGVREILQWIAPALKHGGRLSS